MQSSRLANIMRMHTAPVQVDGERLHSSIRSTGLPLRPAEVCCEPMQIHPHSWRAHRIKSLCCIFGVRGSYSDLLAKQIMVSRFHRSGSLRHAGRELVTSSCKGDNTRPTH